MLATSIASMRDLYDCDCWICFNNLTPGQQEQIGKIVNVTLLEQPSDALPLKPQGVAWKLYPPRLDINRHEVFLDNDLVIFKKMPKIDAFLNQTDTVIYTKSLFHAFGNFKKFISASFRLNSGFFGLPPGFDFDKAVRSYLPTAWADRFDEQGLVALIMSQFPKRIEIELDEVQVCHQGAFGNPEFGYHFVGANEGNLKAWSAYKRRMGSSALLA